MSNRIIVIDDEQDFLDSIKRGLIISGLKDVEVEIDPQNAASSLENGRVFDVALIDVTMPGMNGIELLEIIKNNCPDTECIMVTAVNEARVAVECMKKGAYDYLIKPISRDDLLLTINRALERKRLLDILDLEKKKTLPKLDDLKAFKPIVTQSPKVLKVMKEAELHAASNMPVFITGESGTGKELLARAIHDASPRFKFAFSAINMASLTSNLFDAEFFGHTKGAFTGAETDREGYLEHAHRGTLFLDEIGNLPLELQGKLLRALQEGEYIKLGTDHSRRADVRFIAATNTDLDRLMSQGSFRKDLYYRLKGAWLHLPPLRERKGDIPMLIDRFLEEFCDEHAKCRIDEPALSNLVDYYYPGNIRELRSIIQSALNLSRGQAISTTHLPKHLQKRKLKSKHQLQTGSDSVRTLIEIEKAHILKIYEQTGRNKSQAAKLLGIGLNTLRRKLVSFGAN